MIEKIERTKNKLKGYKSYGFPMLMIGYDYTNNRWMVGPRNAANEKLIGTEAKTLYEALDLFEKKIDEIKNEALSNS
jgi:hypothetical protein